MSFPADVEWLCHPSPFMVVRGADRRTREKRLWGRIHDLLNRCDPLRAQLEARTTDRWLMPENSFDFRKLLKMGLDL